MVRQLKEKFLKTVSTMYMDMVFVWITLDWGWIEMYLLLLFIWGLPETPIILSPEECMVRVVWLISSFVNILEKKNKKIPRLVMNLHFTYHPTFQPNLNHIS